MYFNPISDSLNLAMSFILLESLPWGSGDMEMVLGSTVGGNCVASYNEQLEIAAQPKQQATSAYLAAQLCERVASL